MSQRYDASAKAAQDIDITVLPLGVRDPDDFNEAFAAMDRTPPDAILMVTDVAHHTSIASGCSTTRLRTACPRSTSRTSWRAPAV